MNAFGLTTAGSAVLLRTDSETAVSALIRRANLGIRVVTQRAPPQGHESVGGVERAVRSLKELFSTVRLDLRAQGYDIKRSPRAFELGLIYCAAMHNHHSAAFDGRKSPQELVLQRPLPECGSSLIGVTVLAELPDSMKSSSLSRFVEAAYLYPEVGGLTHVVSSLVEGTPQHYRAKSIKHITPLKVGIERCEHLLKVYDPSDTLAPPILKESEDGIPEGVQGEVDTAFEGKVSQGPTTDMSRVGPPAAWVREHGGTLGCPACGEKRGKANHNAACKQRYDRWLKGQRERLVAAKEPGSDGVAPELGPARRVVASEEPGSAGVAPELAPARVVPEPGSGSAPSVPVPSEGRSSVDAGVPGVTPPLLKRRRTREQSGSGSVDRPGEGSATAWKSEVTDVEMQDDPSIPYENIADTEMDPGFFEGEAPMQVEQGVEEGNEAVGMDLGDELPRMADLFDEAPGCA